MRGITNAEYHEGWMYFCNRGDTVTKSTTVECFGGGCVQESENQYANERYTLRWIPQILNNTGRYQAACRRTHVVVSSITGPPATLETIAWAF